MKRKILLSVLIILLIFSLTLTILAEKQVYDFRKTNWGMSKEQVGAMEDKKLDGEDDNTLGYKVKIGEDNFACFYFFLEDKLYRSGYVFDEEHTNNNLYINDYEKLKEVLIKKYSKPKTDKITWKNDLFKNDKQDWGTAISIGHLLYGATWETPSTIINLALNGDNYKIRLIIYYESKELKEWADKILEEKAKNNF